MKNKNDKIIKEMVASRWKRFLGSLYDDLFMPLLIMLVVIIPMIVLALVLPEKALTIIGVILMSVIYIWKINSIGNKNNFRTWGRIKSGTYLIDRDTLKIANKEQFKKRELLIVTLFAIVGVIEAILDFSSVTTSSFYLINILLIIFTAKRIALEDWIANTVVVDAEAYELYLEKEKNEKKEQVEE